MPVQELGFDSELTQPVPVQPIEQRAIVQWHVQAPHVGTAERKGCELQLYMKVRCGKQHACAISYKHDVARVQPHARNVHARREQAAAIVAYVQDKPAPLTLSGAMQYL